MFGNGRKTIGVILCDVSSHYQGQVCNTLTSHAKVAGYNVAYFTFYTCYGNDDTRNGRGEANIIHLVPYEDLDAIVFCHDTFSNAAAAERVLNMIEERCTCPVVTLRHDLEKYPCVLVNQKHKIGQLVYHLAEVHDKRRIAFMSGPFDHPDSKERIRDFRQAMADKGLEVDESLIFEGDFWKNLSKEAADYYTMDVKERPEAIVCANDYMAISLANELIEKGFLVPNDIAVTGFDDIWESSINMPPISTVAVPVEAMTREAIKIIEAMWNGEEVERVRYLDAEVAIRNSCGCQTFNMQTMLAKRVRQEKEHQKVLELIQTNTYMFVDLSDLDHVDGIENYLRILEYEDNHVRNFFVCLGEGRGDKYPKYRSASSGFAKKSKAVGAVINRKIVKTEPFDTKKLLPTEASERDPMIYYFFPIHNNQYSFGYFAVSYEGMYGANKTFQNWLAILGNALDNIRIKQKNQGLLQELNNLYIHDALTGLYNRRGFDTVGAEYYSKSRKEKKNFMVMAIDMDNLKVVNDRFGHMNGDLALKTIGAAMEDAADKKDICARVGGDEYNIIGIGYSEEDAKNLTERFQNYLDDFNDTSDLPYLVRASVGYYILPPEAEGCMEDCVNAADAKLYEFKRKKKEAKLDGVLRNEE